MTIKSLSEAVAQQSMIVDSLGMRNAAGLSEDERLHLSATYEREQARLIVLREQLIDAMRADYANDRTQAVANDECQAIMRMYGIH